MAPGGAYDVHSRPFCATFPDHQERGARFAAPTWAFVPSCCSIFQEGNGVLDRSAQTATDLAPPGATPTLDPLPRRLADFATLGEALDYSARGKRGLNFHDARGTLTRAYTFAELREDSLANARRFVSLGIKPGDRIAMIAETG